MRLIDPPYKLCEEILEYFKLYSFDVSSEEKILNVIGKTPSYVKRAIAFLQSCGILIEADDRLEVSEVYFRFLVDGGNIHSAIKIGITNQEAFKEFARLKNLRKSNKQAAQYVIAAFNLKIEVNQLLSIFESWDKYLKSEPKVSALNEERLGFMWININGELIYDEKGHSDFILNQVKNEHKHLGEGSVFVDPKRIEDLKKIKHPHFDFTKLVRKCEELNIAYSTRSFFSVSMLTRSIIDHIPPIFNKNNFTDVAGSYGSKSFKDSMVHLDKSSRKIADSFLHTHIRPKEVLPTKTQVNFSNDLDVLLGEIIRISQ